MAQRAGPTCRLALALALVGVAGCSGRGAVVIEPLVRQPGPVTPPAPAASGPIAPGPPGSMAAMPPADSTPHLDYFAGAPRGAAQFARVCAHGYADKFAQVYCAAATPPPIGSMANLLDLLGLRAGIANGQPTPDVQVAADGLQRINGFNFALTSQSASLVGRDTSLLNPRAVVFDSNPPFVALGFARGAGLVEIAAQDPNRGDINFYLLRYQRACDRTASCTAGDRFTEANEAGWLDVDVYTGNEDLRNTVRQCDTCHRPDGYDYTAGSGPGAILRMTQLQTPWTHWFRSDRGSRALGARFCQTHEGEAYAGVPGPYLCDPPATVNAILTQGALGRAPQLTGGNAQRLEDDMVEAGNYATNAHVVNYHGNDINGDIDGPVASPNAAWTGLFSRVLAGEILRIPSYEIDVFDPNRVAAAQAAYRAVVAGRAAPETLPDMSAALVRDDALPWLSLTGASTNPATGAATTATEIVNQQCATCHGGNFVGAGSRDSFVVRDFPDKLSDDMRLRVGNRICRPSSSLYLMPPLSFATLTEGNRAVVLTALGLPPSCPDERWFPGQAP